MPKSPRLPCDVIRDGVGYDLDLAKQSVGQGWHGIIERLFAAKPTWIQVIQVKEKFGGLRFYVNDGAVRADLFDPAAHVDSLAIPPKHGSQGDGEDPVRAGVKAYWELVQDAEAESFKVCEECGKPGSRCTIDHWIKTLCEACQGRLCDGSTSD